MQTTAHYPKLKEIKSFPNDGNFHVVELTDYIGDGRLDLFIKGDWSDWDAIVNAVAAYRHDAALAKIAETVSTALEVMGIEVVS